MLPRQHGHRGTARARDFRKCDGRRGARPTLRRRRSAVRAAAGVRSSEPGPARLGSFPPQFHPAKSSHGLLKSDEGSRYPVSPLGTRVGPPVRLGCRPDLDVIRRLFGRSLRHRLYRDENAALGFGTEFDATGGQREQRVVLAKADIWPGMPLGAALARNDVAGKHALAAENLQPEPLTIGVAAVAGGAACFLVSHNKCPSVACHITQHRDEIITL